MKEPKKLTVKEFKFMHALFVDGKRLDQCYKAYTPKTKMSKMNAAKEGYKIKQLIIKKIGTWSEVFSQLGLGEERVSQVIAGALGANRIIIRGDKAITVEDWNVRLKAAHDLKDIHGIDAESKIKIDVDVTARDVAANKPYIDIVAETMKQFRKDQEKDE